MLPWPLFHTGIIYAAPRCPCSSHHGLISVLLYKKIDLPTWSGLRLFSFSIHALKRSVKLDRHETSCRWDVSGRSRSIRRSGWGPSANRPANSSVYRIGNRRWMALQSSAFISLLQCLIFKSFDLFARGSAIYHQIVKYFTFAQCLFAD